MAETLRETLEKYHIEIPDEQIEKLDLFCHLLWDWNTKLNLTRHTDYEKFVTRDLIDTMALAEFLAPKERVLDVGSGSGVPGIVLGILRPDISISLVECVGKKAKVLSEIIHELQLPIPVYEALGQDLLGYWEFHTLLFRAVASMKRLLEWFRGKWVFFDRMLLVKGPRWINERGEARHYNLLKGLSLRRLKEYTIPGTENIEEDNPTMGEQGAKSVVLQICPEEKLGKDNLCILTAWETSKSRSRTSASRHKSVIDEGSERREDARPPRETKKSRQDQSHRVNRIRNSTHRKSGSRKTTKKDEE